MHGFSTIQRKEKRRKEIREESMYIHNHFKLRMKRFPMKVTARSFSRSSSTPSSSSATANRASLLRSAQCAEILRSSYFSSIKQEDRHISISIADLDELLIANKTRPSLFIPALECGGKVLGTLSNIIPGNIAKQMDEIINEGVVQCLNDSIREEIAMKCSDNGSEDIDVRDSLKFHRDIARHVPLNEKQNSPDRYEFMSQGIYQILKFSRLY